MHNACTLLLNKTQYTMHSAIYNTQLRTQNTQHTVKAILYTIMHYALPILLHLLLSSSEAKAAAQTYDCKYIEVSAILNHRVDELLVGVVKQLRHKPERDKKRKRKSAMMRMESGDTGCLSHCRQSALSVLFGAPLKFLSKSSDNLLSI